MREAVLQEGESPEQARTRLRLDEREAEWHAAQGLGCQVVAASGLLGPPGGPAGCVGHLVTKGQVRRADNSTGDGCVLEVLEFCHICLLAGHGLSDPAWTLVSMPGVRCV